MATAAAFSADSSKNYNVRCVSLPARSRPVNLKIEEELNKLQSREISVSSSSNAEKICSGLSGLGELYRVIGELFSLPLTQEALAQHHHENWVNNLLDGLLRYLEICSNTRDAVLMIKESVRELQSALRRSKCGELSIERNVNAYICSRKKMKKEITNCLASLRQMEDMIGSLSSNSELNDHVSVVIKLLRRTSSVSTSIFSSLLSFLSVPMMKPRPNKWSLVLKLVHKKVATFEGQCEVNELENADIALSNLSQQLQSKDVVPDHLDQKIESAQEKLDALDVSIESFEYALECLFRRLIHARVSLLNILSHYI